MDGPLAVLTVALRHLHRRAGEPSTREIGKAISYSHTTVAKILKDHVARPGGLSKRWSVISEATLRSSGSFGWRHDRRKILSLP